MTELRGQPSTGSAWGGGHLALDAIVAYVDEELSSGAQRRALGHLASCPECASEVVAQTQARLALRASVTPTLSSSLLHSLRNIPTETELPEPPAGLAMGPDGELVTLLREPRPLSSRRRPLARLGAGAMVSGLAIGALMMVSQPSAPAQSATASPPRNGVLPGNALDARMQVNGLSASATTVNGAVFDTARVTPSHGERRGASPLRNATSFIPIRHDR